MGDSHPVMLELLLFLLLITIYFSLCRSHTGQWVQPKNAHTVVTLLADDQLKEIVTVSVASYASL